MVAPATRSGRGGRGTSNFWSPWGPPALLESTSSASSTSRDHAFGAHGCLFSEGSKSRRRQGEPCGRVYERASCLAGLSGVCCLGGYLQGVLQLLVSLGWSPVSLPGSFCWLGVQTAAFIRCRVRRGRGKALIQPAENFLVEKPMSSSGGSGSGPYTFCLVSSP